MTKTKFKNKKIGKANPKKASIQKWFGEIYLEAIAPNKLTIKA